MADVWGEAGGEEENTSLQMQPQPNFQPGNTKLQTNASVVQRSEAKNGVAAIYNSYLPEANA